MKIKCKMPEAEDDRTAFRHYNTRIERGEILASTAVWLKSRTIDDSIECCLAVIIPKDETDIQKGSTRVNRRFPKAFLS